MENIYIVISKIPSYKNRRYFVLLGAFLIQLSLGSFYSFVNIDELIVDYMQNHSYSGLKVTIYKSPWIYSIMVFGMGASFSLGGFIENLIGSSSTALIGGWLVSFNICLMFVTMRTYFAIVALSYGLMAGLGIGIAYGVSLAAPVKVLQTLKHSLTVTWYSFLDSNQKHIYTTNPGYFPKNRGLIFGITVSGFGISATIFDAIQDKLMRNVNNKKIMEKLPGSFLILGIIYAFIQAIGSLLINVENNDEVETKSGNSISAQSWIETNEQTKSVDLEPHKIILELDFWILWILMFINSFWIYYFSPMYKKYENHLSGTDLDLSEYLKRISIVSSVFNFAGRIFWGILTDKILFKKVILIITLSCCLLYGALSICLRFISSPMIYIYGTFLVLINLVNSGNSLFFPTVCAKLFGINNFVYNYGMLFTSFSTSAIFSGLLSSFINPGGQTFEISCSVASAVSFLAALITLAYRGRSLMFYQS